MTASRVGRPRDEASRRAALVTARALVLEHGYEALTMAGVAEAAGVGRPTLYRWWRTKEALITAAVLADVLPLDPILARMSGDLRADLGQWMRDSVQRIADPDTALLYRSLLAASLLDPAAQVRMRESFLDPLRSAVRSTVLAAMGGGAIGLQAAVVTSAEAAADLLIGVLLNALVTGDESALSRIGGVVDVVVRGLDSAP